MEDTEQAQLHHTELSSEASPAMMWLQFPIGRSPVLSMGPNWTPAAGETVGLGRKLCAADSSHPKAGPRHRHPALVLSSWASRRICAQQPRPTVIPLEPDIRQLVPGTSTMEPNKFGGGESTAGLYPLLGNNSQAENHKSPWQGTKEK